jgi:hypothetical protein
MKWPKILNKQENNMKTFLRFLVPLFFILGTAAIPIGLSFLIFGRLSELFCIVIIGIIYFVFPMKSFILLIAWAMGAPRHTVGRLLGEGNGEIISFDEEQIVRLRGNGEKESVRWDDLVEISVLLTDHGPNDNDMYLVFAGKDGGCQALIGTKGLDPLFYKIQNLHAFDADEFLEIQEARKNHSSKTKFVVWERKAEEVGTMPVFAASAL